MSNPMAHQDSNVQSGQQFGQPPAAATKEIDIVAEGTIDPDDAVEALKDVIDPELGINIVDLGLLYGISIDSEDNVILDMTLTSAACPLTDVIERQAQMVLEELANQVVVNWVWLPAWGPECITEDGKAQLRAIGFNI